MKDDQCVAAAAAQCSPPHRRAANNSGQKKTYGAFGATVDRVPSENKHNKSESQTSCSPFLLFSG